MSTKARIILSGPGLIGKIHAKIIHDNNACELAGIVGPDSKQNRNCAEEFDVPFYSDFEVALNALETDGVVISTPNRHHYSQAVTCVKRGIPVLVEKPVAATTKEAAALANLADELDVPILVGHHRTYSPLLKKALEFINSKDFGHPVTLQGSALFFKPDQYFAVAPWRTLDGGGPILINMIHEIGVMRTLYGEIVAVQAISSNSVRRFDVEDTVAISLIFNNGALGTFILSDTASSSKSWEMTSGENPAYPHFKDEACYHLSGTNGSLDFPSMQTKTYETSTDRSWWKPLITGRLNVERRDPLQIQMNHFVDVILNNVKPLVSARDGYINMVVVDAIQQSSKMGRLIEINF